MVPFAFVVALVCATIHKSEAAPTVAEERQEFFESYAKKPGLGYLTRVAQDAQRRKAVQHKIPVKHDAPELLKRVRLLEANGANATDTSHSIAHNNQPLTDFLYQGDLILSEPQAVAVNLTRSLKQYRAGGFLSVGNGVKMPVEKWPHESPICFRFKNGSDPLTMEVARKAFQFWTENSCLRWEENCVSKPTIVITTDTRGCNTSPGRFFQSITTKNTKAADGAVVTERIPVFGDEQAMSLKAPGCTFFAAAAHEASHVMGMWHEQARPDRDNYIDVVWSNVAEGWEKQYNKAEGSDTLGIAYDYASNMQYTGYANDPKIDMAAKEPIYQHTMGSKYGPIFNDIKFVNVYNGCMCNSGITCANSGFPHPLHCDSKCVCPEGFGGATCAERQQGENGAPAGCGATLTATADWQTARVSVPAPQVDEKAQPRVSIRQACCTWWIKGTGGKRVEIQLESVTPGSNLECKNDCWAGGTEVKFGDLTRGGARVCCTQHAKEFGTVTTTTDMAIVRVCSMRNTHAAAVKFRTTG